MTRILGPIPCITCRKAVWWDRVGSGLRLMEGRKPHQCIDSPLPKSAQKMAA